MFKKIQVLGSLTIAYEWTSHPKNKIKPNSRTLSDCKDTKKEQ